MCFLSFITFLPPQPLKTLAYRTDYRYAELLTQLAIFLSNFKSNTLDWSHFGKFFYFYSVFCCPYIQYKHNAIDKTYLIPYVGLLSLPHRTCGNIQRKGVCLICHQMLQMSQKIIGLSSSNWWVTMEKIVWRCCHLCTCDVHIFFPPVFCIFTTLTYQTGQLADSLNWLKLATIHLILNMSKDFGLSKYSLPTLHMSFRVKWTVSPVWSSNLTKQIYSASF